MVLKSFFPPVLFLQVPKTMILKIVPSGKTGDMNEPHTPIMGKVLKQTYVKHV